MCDYDDVVDTDSDPEPETTPAPEPADDNYSEVSQLYAENAHYQQPVVATPKKKRKKGCCLLGCLGCGGTTIILIICAVFYMINLKNDPGSILDVDSWVNRKIFVMVAPAIIEKAIKESPELPSAVKNELLRVTEKIVKAVDNKEIKTRDLEFLARKLEQKKKGNDPNFTEKDFESLKNLLKKANIKLDDLPTLKDAIEKHLEEYKLNKTSSVQKNSPIIANVISLERPYLLCLI